MNKVNDLRIEINQYPYMDNKLYVSLGIHAGFAYKEYMLLKNRSKRITLNQASANVFMEYMRLKTAQTMGKMVRTNTTTNASVLTFFTNVSTFDKDIQQIMDLFYEGDFDEKLFVEAKANCVANFQKNYKDIEFRAYTKLMEFSDQRKEFDFHQFTQAIQAIQSADIRQFREMFVNYPNTFLLINGHTDKIKEADFFYQLKETKRPGDVFVPSIHLIGDALAQDRHLSAMDKQSYRTGAVHFDFDSESISVHDRFALLQLIGHSLFKHHFAVSVDALDASILYKDLPLLEYKDKIIVSLTEENVKEACLSIQEEVEYMLVEKPYQFNALFASLYVNGIDLIKYYVTIKTYRPEFIKKIMKLNQEAITECHIRLEQGASVNYV